MKQIKIVIEKTKNHYSAYSENVDGIFGAGDTPAEAKQSIVDAIRLLKKYNKPHNIPSILKGDYEIVYRFDAESLLNYYKKIFTNSALERITGINQRQLQHYSSGLKKPRLAQKKKIETALHQLGSELLAIVL
jgi:predicted RNase H-like HicB family nuclease